MDSFQITSISRADLETLGFNTSKITDEMMMRLAEKMEDDYVEQMFWVSAEIIAGDVLNFPKRKKRSKK